MTSRSPGGRTEEPQDPVVSWQHDALEWLARRHGGGAAAAYLNRLLSGLVTEQGLGLLDIGKQSVETQVLGQLAAATHHALWGRGARAAESAEALLSLLSGDPVGSEWVRVEALAVKLTGLRMSQGGAAFEQALQQRGVHLVGGALAPHLAARLDSKMALQRACRLLNEGRTFDADIIVDEICAALVPLDVVSQILAHTVGRLCALIRADWDRADTFSAALKRLWKLLSEAVGSPRRDQVHRSALCELATWQKTCLQLVDAGVRRLPAPRESRARLAAFFQTREVPRAAHSPSGFEKPSVGRLADVSQAGDEGLQQYVLLSAQALVTINLRRGHVLAARQTMHRLVAAARASGISPSILNFEEENLEIDVLGRELAPDFFERASRELAAAVMRADQRAGLRLRMLRGAGLVLAGQPEQGLLDLEQALVIGEGFFLMGDLPDVLFHLAGARLAAGHKGRAARALMRCAKLLQEQGNGQLAGVAAYHASALAKGRVAWGLFMDTLRVSEVGMVRVLADLYPFSDHTHVRVWQDGAERRMPELKLRRWLQSLRGRFALYAPEEHLLGQGTNGKLEQVIKLPGNLVDDGFGDVVQGVFESHRSKQSHGLTLEDLHSLRTGGKIPFNDWRHGTKVRTFIGRLRQLLAGTGWRLEWDARGRRYHLNGEGPVLTLRGSGQKHRKSGESNGSKRCEDIMTFAQGRGAFAVGDLCLAWDVSRQALHPYLQALVQQGKLRLVRKGRRSLYRVPVST